MGAFGIPWRNVVDPTDLLALPFLLLGDSVFLRHVRQLEAFPRRRLELAALVALVPVLTATGETEVCGDGQKTDGELCDDGNRDDTDRCRNHRTVSSCGDGVLDEPRGEKGDGPDLGGNTVCTSRCLRAFCGDGSILTTNTFSGQFGCLVADGLGTLEDCDDGNASTMDGCTSCKLAKCGDGFVPSGSEGCDDGNRKDTDGCTNACTVATCGDGIVRAGAESCEPTASGGDALCNANCTPDACGDGVLNRAANEACGDGNTAGGDGCSSTCTTEGPDAGTTCAPNGKISCSTGNQGNPCCAADQCCEFGCCTTPDCSRYGGGPSCIPRGSCPGTLSCIPVGMQYGCCGV